MAAIALAASSCGTGSWSESADEAAISGNPDYAITAVSAPPSAAPGSLFRITSTICNAGGVVAPPTEVLLVTSLDTTIDASDLAIALRAVPALQPGQCDTEATGVAAFQTGAFHIGAIADPFDDVVEDGEANNQLAGNAIGVGFLPDLIVTSIAGPPSANGSFQAAVTVCNQGTQFSSGFTPVLLYASPDPTITGVFEDPVTHDSFLGRTSAGVLGPRQCQTVSISATMPPPGALHLGAIVDELGEIEELLEANNHTTGALTGFGEGPDLIVTSMSGPPSAPSASSAFRLAATVCNQGTQPSPFTVISFYASLDTTITGQLELAPDHAIGFAIAGSLAPGQCETVAADGFIPAVTGALYLGAIVDEFGGVSELIESNNRTTGALTGFGPGPDLVVTAVSGPPSANGTFRITSTVCNQGTQASPGGGGLRLYVSADPAITGILESPFSPDLFVGVRPVASLQPGQCDEGSVDAFAPPVTGAFHLGAIVDEPAAIDELIESNNHTTGALIGLGSGPDLVVQSISAPPSTNAALPIRSTVCNQGTQPSPGTAVRFYASPDTTITGEFDDPFQPDRFIAVRPIGPLQPGQCDTASTDSIAQGETSALFLGAIVDEFDLVGELIESNNHTTGGLTGFGDGPDLIVTSVSGPPSASAAFRLAATVCNQGTQPSFGFGINFYASLDTTITGQLEVAPDHAIGVAGGGTLSPGQCETVSTDAFGIPATGALFLGAIVDEFASVSELIESNNRTTGPLIGLGFGPDLVVTAVSGPPSANTALRITSTVCNQGTTSSPGGGGVRLYVSADPTITGTVERPFSPDLLVGARPVAPLQPGQCDTAPIDVFAPSVTGSFFLGAIVDEPAAIDELIESNNHATGPLIGLGNGPDLVVRSIAAPPSASAAFPITATVCNQGTQSSPSTGVRFYASPDTTITGVAEDPFSPDDILGITAVPALAPGQCSDAPATVAAPLGPAARHLGAIVDEDGHADELIESNNHATGALTGFGDGPDLIVTAVSGPPSTLGVLDLTATVCNQGTQPSFGALVSFYLSLDTTITSQFEASADQFLGVVGSGFALWPGQCEMLAIQAFVPGVTEPRYLGAIVDDGRAIAELIESNNRFTGALTGFGSGPDFVVTSLAASPAHGGLEITATVCNRGTTTSPTVGIEFYASNDAVITGIFESHLSPDLYLGGTFTPFLVPGQCGPVEFQTVIPPPGSHLGAVVDERNAVAELIESNNRISVVP